VKENPNLVVNGRLQCLVANGRIQCLVANGRLQCLVANGRLQCLEAIEGSNAWWPLKGSNVWWSMEGEGTPFHLLSLSPQQILLKPSIFPLILRFYFTMVLGRYLCIFFIFFDL
jgi:hypothetical protein